MKRKGILMTKKRFKFNIIDVFIVLFVLAAAAGAIWFFTVVAGGETGYVEFTVEVREAMPELFEAIEIGGEIRDSVRNYFLGHITDVSYQNAVTTTFSTDDEVFTQQHVPDRLDIFITIRGRGNFNPSEILSEGQNVRVGQTKYLRGRGFAAIGTVVGISIFEY